MSQLKRFFFFIFTRCFLLLTDQPVKGLLDLGLGKGGNKRGGGNHMHIPFAKNPCSLTVLFCSPDEMKHLGPICLVNIKVPFHQLKIGFCIPIQQPLEYKVNSLSLPPSPKSFGGKGYSVSILTEPVCWMHAVISAEIGVFITFVVADQAQLDMQNGNKASQLCLRSGIN